MTIDLKTLGDRIAIEERLFLYSIRNGSNR
jgi:hypothetical protein